MRELDATATDFASQLDDLLAWDMGIDSAVDVTVAQIIKRIRSNGDAELLALTRQFDNVDAASAAELEIQADELAAAWARIDTAAQQALSTAPGARPSRPKDPGANMPTPRRTGQLG